MDSIARKILQNGGAAGDPYYQNTSLLMHFDGSNGSTTFVDNSFSPKTFLRNGTCSIQTSQSMFGGSSIYFAGGSDRITTAGVSDFDFGSGEFTLEAWIRPTSISGTFVIIDRGRYADYTPWSLQQYNATIRLACSVSYSGWSVDILTGNVLTANTWHHVAATRTGNVFRIFVNGVQGATTTTSITLPSAAESVQIGRDTAAVYGFVGYMDELRVTKGISRYSSDFTPIGPFPNY